MDNNNLPAIYDDEITSIADKAEKRVKAINKIKTIALQVTNNYDWTDQGGKPYLQVSGAEKIARLFDLSWSIDEPQLDIDDEGHFTFTYKGNFRMGKSEIEAIGTRSSKDGFFSVSGLKPISEIDRGNVKKAAYTNCIGSGITRLLGLRNLSWDDLATANIKKENVSRIDYKKAEMSGDAKEQRKQIEDMLNEMCGNDPKKFEACLMKITAFTGRDGSEVAGKKKLSDLSEKAIPVTFGKVKEKYDEWKKGAGLHEQPLQGADK